MERRRRPFCRRFRRAPRSVAGQVGYRFDPPPGNTGFARRGAHDQEEARARRDRARGRGGRRGARRSARRPARRSRAATFKAAWIYVGPHNDGGWSQAHDQGRLYVQKMLGSKVQTTYKENVPEGPQVAQVIEQPRPRRQQDHLRDVVRLPATRWPRRRRSTRTSSSRWRPARRSLPNMAEYYGAGEDAIYLSGMAAGAATKTRHGRLRRPVRDPRGDPAHERVHARRPEDASGREGEDRLDELVVRPGQGEEGRREPRTPPAPTCSARTSTARPTGQYAESTGVPWVGYDSNAQKFAPKSWLTAPSTTGARTTSSASRPR